MSEFLVEPGREGLGEYKIVVDWVDMINSLSSEVIQELTQYNQLATEILYATPQRYQHNGIVVDWEWNESPRYEAIKVWTLIAEASKIKNVKANLRITRN
jgi:hypothetical protein